VVEFALKSLQKKGTESTASVIGLAFMNALGDACIHGAEKLQRLVHMYYI